MEKKDDSYKVKKLKKLEEWPQWKFQMRIILQASDLIQFVNGKEPVPKPNDFQEVTEYNKAVAVFEKGGYKAQRDIVTALGKDTMLHVLNCETALEMWKKLESVFEQKSLLSINMIQERFYNFTMEPGDSMTVLSSKLQSIVKQLKDLGEKVSDSMTITKLLLSLPPEFNHFLNHLRNGCPGCPQYNVSLD